MPELNRVEGLMKWLLQLNGGGGGGGLFIST